MRRSSLVGGLVLAALALVTTLLPPLARPAAAATGFDLGRLAGSDRYATAATIAQTAFPGGAPNAVLATGEAFPDALAGGFLAGNLGAPVLLTTRAGLSPVTKSALGTLKTRSVTILGGTGAVSQAVEDELRATASTASGGGNLTVTRIAGGNRYQTARQIATATGTSVGPAIDGRKTAILARGELFPDALAGGALSYAGRLPILTTPGGPATTLGPDAEAALEALAIEQVIILGGTGAISAETELAVRNARGTNSITTVRLQGADRTETARAIAEFALSKLGFTNQLVHLARGDHFADALAGGSWAGVTKAPILLTVSPTTLSSTPGTGAKRYLTDHAATLTGGHIFGGPAAVSTAVEAEAEAAAGTDATPPSIAAATVNGTAETIVLRYTEAVTCANSAASRAQFSYRATVPASPTSVTCNGTETVVLAFADISPGSQLVYTDESPTADAGDVTDPSKNQAPNQTVTPATASDTTQPSIASAAANLVANTVSATYSEGVICGDTAATRSQFRYLGASPSTPTSITCDGGTSVLLTFTDVTTASTLTYTDDSGSPDANDVRDASGNPATSPDSESATVSSDTTPPSMASAVANDAADAVVVTYTEAVECPDLQGTRQSFTFTGASPQIPSSVSCDGTATVTLAFESLTGTGSLTYRDESPAGDANDVRDLAGNVATSPQTITAAAASDSVRPSMVSATANGDTNTVEVTYDEAIKCLQRGDTAAQFTFTGATPQTAVEVVSCGTTAAPTKLTLRFLDVSAGGNLTYTDDDADPEENDVRDVIGNPARSPQTISGVTSTTNAPSMVSATGSATSNTLTVTYTEPVKCPGQSLQTARQFTFTGAAPVQATGITCGTNEAPSATITLTFADVTGSGNLTYTDDSPGIDDNDVRDLENVRAVSPQTIAVTVTTADTTGPSIASATRNAADGTVTITYTEAVVCPAKANDAGPLAFRSQFSFSTAVPSTPSRYDCAATTIKLTFDAAAAPGTLSYTESTDPAMRVKDAAGNEAQSPDGRPVA